MVIRLIYRLLEGVIRGVVTAAIEGVTTLFSITATFLCILGALVLRRYYLWQICDPKTDPRCIFQRVWTNTELVAIAWSCTFFLYAGYQSLKTFTE